MARRSSKRPKRTKVPVPPGGWQAASKKVPVISEGPQEGKVPRPLHVDNEEIQRRHLVWRFSDADTGGEWPISAISPEHMAMLISKMASFESMEIGEIFKPGAQLGKKYPLASLPSHTLARLRDLERDDEDEIARLRCTGSTRLSGFLREHVFHVIWWDPEHRVYPSAKKHT